MEKRVQLLLLLVTGFFISYGQIGQNTFNSYARAHTLNETATELHDTLGNNYKSWMKNKATRTSVILFCDSAIDRSIKAIMDYNTYKKAIKNNTSAKDPALVNKYGWYFSRRDSSNKIVSKDSIPKYDKEGYKKAGYNIILNFIKPLISFLLLDRYELEERGIIMDLSLLQNHHTLQLLYNNYEYAINNASLNIPEAMQLRNKQLIAHRFEVVEANNFTLYQSYSAKSRAVKSVEFFMDNDLLSINNQDREYTGGGALSIATDYFKWRWLNLGWFGNKNWYKRNSDSVIINKRQVLTYQSFKVGMHFYTPYIRYRDNFALADTLFKHDRPFGSYVFVERSKYRLWPNGLVRHQGNFQVGKLGTNAGRDIQAMLHKDAVTSSQKVYGWQNQIADGGRWLLQLNHKADVLLFSTTNRYCSIFKPSKMYERSQDYYGLSIYNSTEVFWGGYYSAVGTGIYFSLLDFTKQSGQNLVAASKRRIYEFGINVETGFRYRYVRHNSMLEGLGYGATFIDDPYDDEAENSYTIATENVQRNIFMGELKINVKWRKMVAYIAFVVQNKEYTTKAVDYNAINSSLINPLDMDYYKNTVIAELNTFNKAKTYGYGRMGVVWIVD